jgi:hypothetical protein
MRRINFDNFIKDLEFAKRGWVLKPVKLIWSRKKEMFVEYKNKLYLLKTDEHPYFPQFLIDNEMVIVRTDKIFSIKKSELKKLIFFYKVKGDEE